MKRILAGLVATAAVAGCKPTAPGADSQTFQTGFNLDNLVTPPSNLDRDFTCPTAHRTLDATVDGKPMRYLTGSATERAAVWGSLTGVLRKGLEESRFGAQLEDLDLSVTAILVRRQNGVPSFLYLSNGMQDVPVETQSSSKFIAFAALASKLREKSGGRVGIDGTVSDPNGGQTPIGDLITESTTYEFSCFDPKYCGKARHVGHLTSNNVSVWAKNLAGRAFANSLFDARAAPKVWIPRTGERFDGGYAAQGTGWGNTVTMPDGQSFALSPSGLPSGAANKLSTFSSAEALKRMVMTRENPELALPHTNWADMATLFYGAPQARSKYFPHFLVGGMQGGAGTYIQAAFGADGAKAIEKATLGQWRTFNKVGWGPGGSEYGNDFLWHGYGCVPKFDERGKATAAGKEFILSARLGRKSGRHDKEADRQLSNVVRILVNKIMSGQLDNTKADGSPAATHPTSVSSGPASPIVPPAPGGAPHASTTPVVTLETATPNAPAATPVMAATIAPAAPSVTVTPVSPAPSTVAVPPAPATPAPVLTTTPSSPAAVSRPPDDPNDTPGAFDRLLFNATGSTGAASSANSDSVPFDPTR